MDLDCRNLKHAISIIHYMLKQCKKWCYKRRNIMLWKQDKHVQLPLIQISRIAGMILVHLSPPTDPRTASQWPGIPYSTHIYKLSISEHCMLGMSSTFKIEIRWTFRSVLNISVNLSSHKWTEGREGLEPAHESKFLINQASLWFIKKTFVPLPAINHEPAFPPPPMQ